MRHIVIAAILFAPVGFALAQQIKTEKGHQKNPYYSNTDTKSLNVSNAEWKKILPPALYATAREQATEKPFTGKF